MEPEEEQDNPQNHIPDLAITKPSILSIVLFILIVLIYVPNTAFAGVQFFVAIFLAPLPVIGLFLSLYFGISFAKLCYKWVSKGNLFLPFLILLTIQCICIGICFCIEIVLTGYPIKSCFDTCDVMDTAVVIMRYYIATTILFLPAYCALLQYRIWVKKYNLANPKEFI